MKRYHCIVCLLLLLGGGLCAETLATLSAALDLNGQAGIELVGFSKRVYNVTDDYDYEYDEDDEPIYKDTPNTGWVVQSSSSDNKKYSTYPIKGNSCLRSGLPTSLSKSSDAQVAYLFFKVEGPGTFTFFFKTSCDYSDEIYVYVDGEPAYVDGDTMSGYGPNSEYDWEYSVDPATGTEIVVERRAEVVIDEGMALEDSTYQNTFSHEIVIAFEKSLPQLNWNDAYLPDGPEKPDPDDYEDDKEGYNEAMAEYKAELATFFNTVWIDWVQWTPLPVTLELEDSKAANSFDEDGNYLDAAYIQVLSNAPDMGHSVRYTTDGSTPTSTSPLFDFEDEADLILTQSCTLKAAVFVGDSLETTVGVISKQVTIKATSPVIEVDAEKSTDRALILKATTQFEDNIVVYTMDGTEPTEQSARYDSTTGIAMTNECTVTARCIRPGIISSDTFSLTVEKLPMPTYRLLNADSLEEPNGVTTEDSLTLEVDNPSPTLKYGVSETMISTPFPDTGTLQIPLGTTYLQNQEKGKIPSDIVPVEVKKADTTIVFGKDDLALQPGWNLVSFPLHLTAGSMRNLLQKWPLFGFDPEHKGYQLASTITPGSAYWVFLESQDEAIGIELNGCMATGESPLRTGWNLVGLLNGQKDFASAAVWSYLNGQFAPLQNNEKLALWKGYYVRF